MLAKGTQIPAMVHIFVLKSSMTPVCEIKQTTQIRYTTSYYQTGAETNRTSFVCGNRNGYYNVKIRLN